MNWSNYQNLNLLDVHYKENNPGIKVFPYMAYTPLIAKIVELLLEGEWHEPNLINKIGIQGTSHGKEWWLNIREHFRVAPKRQAFQKAIQDQR